jgi:hypothetical protein
MSRALTNAELAGEIRNRFFGERDTLAQALEYMQMVADASDNPAAVYTAVQVVLNTVANCIEAADVLRELGVK